MNVSKFLSKVIGIYLLLISCAMLLNMQKFSLEVNALINDAPLMLVVGFFILILGVLMVVSHNIWQRNWKVLVTIVAWLALLKGASIIFYPQFIDKGTMLFTQNMTFSYGVATIDLLLSIMFCYFGFKE